MAVDDRIADLLGAATADVPPQHLSVPVASIHDRIRRRRRTAVVATAVAVIAVLATGSSLGPRLLGQAAPQPPAVAVSPTADGTIELSWGSAFVARDDTTVTVYTGGEGCRDSLLPEATVTPHGTAQIAIAIRTGVEPRVSCPTGGSAVPFVVTLPVPLGSRMLVNSEGEPVPTFFERHLPELQADVWRLHNTKWSAGQPLWARGYDGPQGASLTLSAQPSASAQPREPVATVDLGPYQGTITGGPRAWTVWWQVGDATYSLQFLAAEGRSMTLEQFEQELALMNWS